MLNIESIYPFHIYKENLIFTVLGWSFLFYLFFHSNFHFLDLLLSNRFCYKLRLCAIKLGADCTCRISSTFVFLSSRLVVIFRFMVVMSYLGSMGKENAVSGRGKDWLQMCISLVSAIWDQRQMSFIPLLGFLCDFRTEGSYLCPSSTEQFSLFPLRAIICDRPGTADA